MTMTLTQLSLLLDQRYEQLYLSYHSFLSLTFPEYGFLAQDCFTPAGDEECYPCIEYSLRNMITIYQRVRLATPDHIHNYLGELFSFSQLIREICKPVNSEHSAYHEYLSIQTLLKESESILQAYHYKNTWEYKSNSAVLFLAKLMQATKSAFTNNPLTDVALFEEVTTQNRMTLKNIADLVCQATHLSPRNIQFIAIGIRDDNQHVITTNYHAPVVFRLIDLLDPERYQEINCLRDSYRKQNRPLSKPNIRFQSCKFLQLN